MKKLFLSFIAALVALTAAAVEADIVVATDGSGDFTSVQEAINSVPDFRKKARTVILIRPGVYKEKIIIPPTKLNLSLIGEDGAVLTYDDYASKLNRFGEEKSTSGSASFYVYAPDFIAENLTFENSAGRVGQAVAAFVAGDRAIFRRCRFLRRFRFRRCPRRGRNFPDPRRRLPTRCGPVGTALPQCGPARPASPADPASGVPERTPEHSGHPVRNPP